MCLKEIVKKSFPFLNEYIPILQKSHDKYSHHNKIRLKEYKASENTFEGHLSCGATCYLLGWYLKNNGFNIKAKKTKFGYGKYLEDHVFLQKDNLIIDPTYRQMFRTYSTKNDGYMNYLYETLPFTFIGTKQEIINMYYDLNNVHQKVYNKKLSDENLIFWQNPEDITYYLDLDKVIENYDYAKKKGKIFFELHNLHIN